MIKLVTADDLCTAAERVLVEHLPGYAAQYALQRDLTVLPGVRDWHQVPTLEALSSANFPAGAITSPGLTGPPAVPSASRGNRVDATWQIEVGIFDRGTDWNDTAARTRTWAALIRLTLLAHPFGGAVTNCKWIGESYRQIGQRNSARTIGGCSVLFDITAVDVADPGAASVDPVVLSTASTVTVRSSPALPEPTT